MVNLDKEKQELMEEIKLLGYESLRYSVFNEHGLSERETRIEFNNETEKYEVYLSRDRAGKGKIFEYTNFEEAKEKFMELLEHTVSRNKYYISNGWAPQYPSPLWNEKEGHQKLRDEAKERSELLLAIQDLGYESLRYSIFNDHRPREWETRIEYNPELEVYEVYSTMDRASTNGKDSYQNFQEARIRFIEILKNVVFINRYYVDEGIGAEYPSPLWDKIEADIENMKYIVEQEIKKRHFESLQYVLFDENKNLPWAFHLYQKNGKFYVNGRDDRSYVMGNTIEFTRFEDAKIAFLERLEHFVKSNQFKVKIGKKPYYSSPLWDNEKAD